MTTITIPKKSINRSIMPIKYPNRLGASYSYENTWSKLDTLSKRLNKLWKTKKTSLQILQEERTA